MMTAMLGIDDPLERLDPVVTRHGDIEDQYVGFGGAEFLEHFMSGFRLPAQLDVIRFGKCLLDPGPDDWMIVCNKDFDHGGCLPC